MRIKGPRTVGLTIVLGSVGAGASAQVQLAEEPWASRLGALEESMASWMEQATIPGLAIAVVTEHEMWARDFGVRGIDDAQRITPGTIFEAASLGKPVFANLVRQEIARGMLDLDAPLNRYWEYPDLSDDERVGSITTRMVLSHRSGLPNWRRDQPLAIQFEPGMRFQYSGEGYVYAQRVLAALTGEDLETRARVGVFEPLGMARSSFLFDGTAPDHALPHHSRGYQLGKRLAPAPGNAAASLHTTATDYGHFLQATLAALRGPEHLALLTAEATEVADGVAWGLGWGLEYSDDRETPSLWHWGDNGPFKAFVYLDPEEGVGFVFFANSTNGLAITKGVLEALFQGAHPSLEWLSYDQLDLHLSPVGPS